MYLPDAMAGNDTETLYFDESGTALLGVGGDGCFVVGGVAIRGDTTTVAATWGQRRPKKKGTKFTRDEFLDVAKFLQANNIVPVTSFSRLDDDDRRNAKQKAKGLVAANVQSPQGEVKKSSEKCIAWMQQVSQTAVSAVLGSLPFVHGPMTSVEIAFDQFTLPAWMHGDTEHLISRWSDPKFRVLPILDTLEARMPGHPDIAKLRASIQTVPGSIQVNWNAAGPLHHLSDAVAAMYRKTLQGDGGANEAWGSIIASYPKAPACMGLDLTQVMKESLARPWPPRRE